jgi:hypothetical protein
VNDEKLKDPTDVANSFNNFVTTITEKLDTLNMWRKGCYFNSKRFILWKLPQRKNNRNHSS